MFDLALRPIKEVAFRSLSQAVPLSITPLHLTGAAFVCGLCACAFAATSHVAWSVACWLLNRALDGIDGTVARTRGQVSELGGFVDLLGDFIVYSLIPISCAWATSPPPGSLHFEIDRAAHSASTSLSADLLAVAFLEASFHINNFVLFYAGAIIEKEKANAVQDDAAAPVIVADLTSIAMRPALIEGLESGVFFTLMLVFPDHVRLLSYLMLAGVVAGTAQRIFWMYSALRTPNATTKVQ